MLIMLRSKVLFFCVFFWFLAGYTGELGAQVLNIERERLKADDNKWIGSAKFSLNLTANTQKFTEFGLDLHLQYKDEKNLYLFLTDNELIKSQSDDFSNKGLVHFRYNRDLTKVIIFEAFTQAQYNKVLSLRFRGLAGVGPRFKILKKEKFRVYSGIAYMYEYEVPVPKEGIIMDTEEPGSYHRISSYVSMSVKLSDNFFISSTTYFQPRVDLISDYRLSLNIEAIFKISERLSFELSYQHTTDNMPLEGMPRRVYSIQNKLVLDFK